MDTAQLIIRSLDEEMVHFDKTVDSTEHMKRDIVQTTHRAFANVDLADVKLATPDAVNAFAKLAAVSMKAIELQENSARNRVTAKLKLQDSRRSDGAAEIVAQMFKQMQDGNYTPDLPTDNLATDADAVAARFTHDNLPPIEDWETRMSPDDLS